MKRIIRFSRFFVPAVVISLLVIAAGIAGYVVNGGFNLGVDFSAGLLQEVQFAPEAFSLTYSGKGNAVVSYSRTGLGIVVTGTEGQNESYSFDFDRYPSMGALTSAMKEQVAGLSLSLSAPESAHTAWLIEHAQGTPLLGEKPYALHFLEPGMAPVSIGQVRTALEPLGRVSVQELGETSERRFMIRLEEDASEKAVPSENPEDGPAALSTADLQSSHVQLALEKEFGAGEIAIIHSDYVGSRFSKQLKDQAGLLMLLTMALILIYSSIRFKPQFAIGAVLSMAHDALVMVAFIAWTRMEFNTTTIAAILTILGYSTNDTIVVFDRIRETKRLYHDSSFKDILDRALSETLGRTVITTVTTMLAVLALFIFTTGSMKDFALALLIGMASGVYSTIYIASSWTLFWERYIKKDSGKVPL